MYVGDLVSGEDIPGLPFSAVYGRVPGGTISKQHSHQDGELFIVLSGAAAVILDGARHDLSVGDSIYIPPFTFHEINNEAADVPFDIVSVGWDDPELAAQRIEEVTSGGAPTGTQLVVVPPPTPNGGLHLGHLAGPYLRADVLVRGIRVSGGDALLVTGTDDPQSYLEVAAKDRGLSAAAVADAEGQRILRSLANWDVDIDVATRPLTDTALRHAVLDSFGALLNSPWVEVEDIAVLVCESCDRELFQGLVVGTCAHCGASSTGDLCEACGLPSTAAELVGPTCRLCGSGSTRTERRERPTLDLRAASASQGGPGATNSSVDLLTLMKRLGTSGVRRYPLTREAAWGTEVDGAHDGMVIDPWLDLCLTYLVAVSQVRNIDDTTLLLGYDNSFYYAALLPAVAHALARDDALPGRYITNRFLNLDGDKFSTSRGHAIWADDRRFADPKALAASRVALLRSAPEGSERSISADTYAAPWSDALLEDIGAAHSVFERHLGEYDGAVPATGAWTSSHRGFYATILDGTRRARALLQPANFQARGYVRLVESIADALLTFVRSEDALVFQSDYAEERRTSVALSALGLKTLAAMTWPVVPTTGHALWDGLGLSGEPRLDQDLVFLPGGHRPQGRVADERVIENGAGVKA